MSNSYQSRWRELVRAGHVNLLRRIRRWGSQPMIRDENSAEHSFLVATHAVALANLLGTQGVKLDFGALVASALLHDTEESITGDVPKYMKADMLLDSSNHSVASKAFSQVAAQLNIAGSQDVQDWLEDWFRRHKDLEEVEGMVIALCDLSASQSVICEEVALGNQFSAQVLQKDCQYYLKKFVRELDDLREDRKGQEAHKNWILAAGIISLMAEALLVPSNGDTNRLHQGEGNGKRD